MHECVGTYLDITLSSQVVDFLWTNLHMHKEYHVIERETQGRLEKRTDHMRTTDSLALYILLSQRSFFVCLVSSFVNASVCSSRAEDTLGSVSLYLHGH